MIASGINELDEFKDMGVGLTEVKFFESKNRIKTCPIKNLTSIPIDIISSD